MLDNSCMPHYHKILSINQKWFGRMTSTSTCFSCIYLLFSLKFVFAVQNEANRIQMSEKYNVVGLEQKPASRPTDKTVDLSLCGGQPSMT